MANDMRCQCSLFHNTILVQSLPTGNILLFQLYIQDVTFFIVSRHTTRTKSAYWNYAFVLIVYSWGGGIIFHWFTTQYSYKVCLVELCFLFQLCIHIYICSKVRSASQCHCVLQYLVLGYNQNRCVLYPRLSSNIMFSKRNTLTTQTLPPRYPCGSVLASSAGGPGFKDRVISETS